MKPSFYFPIRVKYIGTNEEVIVTTSKGIVSGNPFVVLECHVHSKWSFSSFLHFLFRT